MLSSSPPHHRTAGIIRDVGTGPVGVSCVQVFGPVGADIQICERKLSSVFSVLLLPL